MTFDAAEFVRKDFLSTHVGADGKEARSFYSLRESAWHSLGTVVDRPLSDPDIAKVAGLNWTAEKVGLRLADDMTPVADSVCIVRSDNRKQLGVVGSRYECLQNADLFRFFRDIAGIKDFTVETAGALMNGETVWALARIPGLTLEKGDDVSNGYLLIKNKHDGTGSVRIAPTMIRVVCQNTMRMATSEIIRRGRKHGKSSVSGGYAIRHTSGLLDAMQQVSEAYARTMEDFETTRAAFSALTSKVLSASAFDAMMAAAFKLEAAPDEKTSKAAETINAKRKDRIGAILASGTCEVKGTAGTVWAGLQAIGEYIDHEGQVRALDPDRAAMQRFASSCFDGTGAHAKERAWDAALALV